MVHVPTRGGVPVRLGPGVPITPGYGASTMSRQPYTDPMQFELEREKVLGATWLMAARSSQIACVAGSSFSFFTFVWKIVCPPISLPPCSRRST